MQAPDAWRPLRPDSAVPSGASPRLVALKGRGAVGNVVHRYALTRTEPVDDGWPSPDDDEDLGDAGAGHTEVREEYATRALSRNLSPDVPFSLGLNPYRGCEHGCVYCYARPTHSYLGWSPGLDFERRLVAKVNIAQRLARELDAPSHARSPIVIGTVTDAYQPVERRLRLTRAVLEVLVARRHPFSIITKSAGVERDLDLIAPMAAQGLASVCVSLCTLDGALARRLEPRAAAPARRLRTIRTLAQAGVPVGVSLAPQMPFLNDDMEQVLAAARDAGASHAFYTVLRLPWELGEVFEAWLQVHYPERAARVMARMRDLRAGQRYDARPGWRMRGQGIWAQLLAQRFEVACRRLGLNNRERVFGPRQAAVESPQAQDGRSAELPQQGELF